MNWIERCPECNGIDYRGTICHIFLYLTSSKYRRLRRNADDWAYVLDRLVSRTYIQGGDTIHIPKIESLTDEL